MIGKIIQFFQQGKNMFGFVFFNYLDDMGSNYFNGFLFDKIVGWLWYKYFIFIINGFLRIVFGEFNEGNVYMNIMLFFFYFEGFG